MQALNILIKVYGTISMTIFKGFNISGMRALGACKYFISDYLLLSSFLLPVCITSSVPLLDRELPQLWSSSVLISIPPAWQMLTSFSLNFFFTSIKLVNCFNFFRYWDHSYQGYFLAPNELIVHSGTNSKSCLWLWLLEARGHHEDREPLAWICTVMSCLCYQFYFQQNEKQTIDYM